MGMSQLRIIFFMGAMNKMLEFMVTHGEENRECQAPNINTSKQLLSFLIYVCHLTATDSRSLFFILASEQLVIEAEEKGVCSKIICH